MGTRNQGFTGSARGGEKGLWFSAAKQGDNALVISESAIDALSYAVLHPDAHTRYASIGGAMNPNQPALIRSAIQKLGKGARLIIATDNDEDGRKLAETIAALAGKTGRQDVQVVRDLPKEEGADWNAVLQAWLRSGVLKSVL